MADATAERRVVLVAALVGLATIVVGLTVHWLTGRLAASSAPFISGVHPELHPLAVVSVATVAVGLLAAPRILRLPSLAFAAAAFGLFVVLGLALNVAREGTLGWYGIFDTGPGGSFEAVYEYLPALPALSYGPGFFLDRFAELVPSLPINAAGHPPALPLLLHALGISTAQGMAALCVGVGGLGAPATYLVGRQLGGERVGRVAALLFAFSPDALLFGVTSADLLYAAVGALAAVGLVARSRAGRAAGCLALAVASLFSWALLAIGAWAVLVAWGRGGRRAGLNLAAGCALTVLALDGLLAAAWGYDPVGTLRATSKVYDGSLAHVRPWWFWALGSPVAWAATQGLPVAWGALRAAARRRPEALALAAVIAVAAGLAFSKAETERIWLIFTPLACVAAAGALPVERLRLLLTLAAAQALVSEVLLYTIW